jgi:hypothetical protein
MAAATHWQPFIFENRTDLGFYFYRLYIRKNLNNTAAKPLSEPINIIITHLQPLLLTARFAILLCIVVCIIAI